MLVQSMENKMRSTIVLLLKAFQKLHCCFGAGHRNTPEVLTIPSGSQVAAAPQQHARLSNHTLLLGKNNALDNMDYREPLLFHLLVNYNLALEPQRSKHSWDSLPPWCFPILSCPWSSVPIHLPGMVPLRPWILLTTCQEGNTRVFLHQLPLHPSACTWLTPWLVPVASS